MKVAKKVRLLNKDSKGKFIKNETYEVLRNRSIVTDLAVAQTEANYKDVGILWIVDEKATKERNAKKAPKKATKKITKETPKTED